jgi:hypothetical protein
MFTRQWRSFVDNLDMMLTGAHMRGVLPNTDYSGPCSVGANRL